MASPRAPAKKSKMACEKLKRIFYHESGERLQRGARFGGVEFFVECPVNVFLDGQVVNGTDCRDPC